MRITDIIEKKKYGQPLSKDEIQFFIDGALNGSIADYQTSALLMAICINLMNKEEIFNLTRSMLNSGKIVDLSSVNGITVDKHSTGGVGDSTTLALAPILACCGVYVAKMSGRGLGFSGGTLDKLESVPGLTVSIDERRFLNIVNDIGCAVIGQSKNIAPADKKLYALRDVTATVDCIPLIASSIMSKKLASGADVILLDVKYGSGAFMKTVEQAIELSKCMVEIGINADKKIGALITDMNQPLSMYVGNNLEIIGIIEVLNNRPSRLRDEIIEIGSKLLALSRICDEASGRQRIIEAISSSKALYKFRQMIIAQGGDVSYIDNPSKFTLGQQVRVKATKKGYVESFKTDLLGTASVILGGGRQLADDDIDYSVGLKMNAEIGNYLNINDTIATIYHNNNKGLDEAIKLVTDSVNYSQTKPDPHKIALAYVTADGVINYSE